MSEREKRAIAVLGVLATAGLIFPKLFGYERVFGGRVVFWLPPWACIIGIFLMIIDLFFFLLILGSPSRNR